MTRILPLQTDIACQEIGTKRSIKGYDILTIDFDTCYGLRASDGSDTGNERIS